MDVDSLQDIQQDIQQDIRLPVVQYFDTWTWLQIPNLAHNFEFRYGIQDRFHFYTDLVENFKNVHEIS